MKVFAMWRVIPSITEEDEEIVGYFDEIESDEFFEQLEREWIEELNQMCDLEELLEGTWEVVWLNEGE